MSEPGTDASPDTRNGPPAFAPRVAVASLSGESDAAWARAAAPHVGCAFLGGIALDEPTREAARGLVDRDREEFLPEDPLAFVDRQLSALAGAPLRPAFNVRAAGPSPVAEAAAVCAEHGAVIEVNAHCRQEEMCVAGAGQSLLHDPERLAAQVRAASEAGATVSVKCRTEVPGVDLPAVCRKAHEAGAALLHVDAMDSEGVVATVVAACPDAFVVANNGVRDRRTVREYLANGADAVSVGRPSDRPEVLRRVRAAVDEWFDGDREGPGRPSRAATDGSGGGPA
ncbi:tRNA-dihydrouridine synthase [Haloglomus halophilum]|uniref:tRNA-dihydrouridine synthase n=1 Tax=Haloglomus halophilum TaxID=2962672 RepID=UPI0020CA0072|nr:tRNA-dihydrouridine synthase [Haloglomus halophilum]